MPEVTFMDSSGHLSDADFQAYWDVHHEAFAIHADREAVRHALWKDYPAEDQVQQVKIKTDRTIRSLDNMSVGDPSEEIQNLQREHAIQELLDIINYSNFAIRKLRGE